MSAAGIVFDGVERRLSQAAKLAVAVALLLSISGLTQAAETRIVASGLGYTEGTIFVDSILYFVDYSNSDVLRLVEGKVQRVWHQDGCGANGLVENGRSLLVACYDGNTIVRISLDGATIDTIRSDKSGNGFSRPNDLATDHKGGVYFSASGDSTTPGKIYYITPRGLVLNVANGIRYANGLAVGADGHTLYVAESETDSLYKYYINLDGTLQDKRLFLRLDDLLANANGRATPDGVRLDKHGRLFVGLYRGGGFAVMSPEGKLLSTVNLPGPHHANLAISPDGLAVYGTVSYDQDGGYEGAIYETRNPVTE
ncbi:MAG TPA: SMP-30/gluconolactonase/LRE family protein [Usitatibacter sp.]|jgi:gluconolactonase|nr:SMP-30/gluconolactonase/LRE family protein [Usitatibacter sp.]